MRYSEIASFNNCPQQFKWRKDGLVKRDAGAESNDKNWGAAIHAGLEAHYKGVDLAGAKEAFLRLYPADLDEAKPEKSVESGLLCLEEYVKYYAGRDSEWRVIGTEVQDVVRIGDEEHGLHIDLIAEHLPSRSIYFWDHKTTGKAFGYTYWKKYEIDAQMTRYTEYIIQKYGSCAGCVINGIAVGHRQRAYKGEPAGHWQKFERQIFNRTPQQIRYWKQSDQEWAKMIAFSEQAGVWPRNLGSLCGWCEFYELCLSGADEQIRELMYEYRTNSNSEKEVGNNANHEGTNSERNAANLLKDTG